MPNFIDGKRLKKFLYEILPFSGENTEVQRGSGIYTTLHESEALQDPKGNQERADIVLRERG